MKTKLLIANRINQLSNDFQLFDERPFTREMPIIVMFFVMQFLQEKHKDKNNDTRPILFYSKESINVPDPDNYMLFERQSKFADFVQLVMVEKPSLKIIAIMDLLEKDYKLIAGNGNKN